ncbi:MAG: hypothetical protein NTY90_05705 [Candidatus Micrarchaeota archaeon]|nr:hypothetical protein [Candidatus Micrarchaeota archaeon]
MAEEEKPGPVKSSRGPLAGKKPLRLGIRDNIYLRFLVRKSRWEAQGKRMEMARNALNKRNESARKAIVEVIAGQVAKVGGEEDVKSLAESFDDPLEVVRAGAARGLWRIEKRLREKEVTDPHAKALKIVAPHISEPEAERILPKAFKMALKGKITPDNAGEKIMRLRKSMRRE